jgi:hypothetical protein
MTTHAKLRGFLAGIFVPTLVLPLMLTVFIVVRIYLRIPVPIERALVFPMALVPCIWGLWNLLWVETHEKTRLSLGAHGALLPLLLLPGGALIGCSLGVFQIQLHGVCWFGGCTVPYVLIVPVLLAVIAGYYLVWKYIVGAVNRILGIA